MLHRCTLPLGAIALVLTLAAPAAAQEEALPPGLTPPGEQPTDVPRVDVGIGENRGSFLGDPAFDQLGLRKVRLIVPYDVVRSRGRRLRDTDGWLRAAHDRGLDVLVSFGFSQRRRLRWHMPTTRQYRIHVSAFMRRYPWVREYSTWNEANHKRVQPTGTRAARTAVLYRMLRRLCRPPACQPLAVDVLLTGSKRTWRWIRTFKRRAGRGHHIWGVHNYPDANRLSTRQTRRFLRTVKGDIWFTETGGIVRFGRSWRRDELRAADAVNQVFRLAELSPRIKRVYLYSWKATRSNRRWDSGLLSAAGRLRPAYHMLVEELSLDRFNPKLPVPQPPAGDLPPLKGQPGQSP